MVKDGNYRGLVKQVGIQQNCNSYQIPAVQRIEGEQNIMETEGRVFSDLYRNSSEELFLKSLMESSIGLPVPTMEMLGFKNLNQNFRTDSEELFKSWLMNGENHGHNSSSIAYRTRQASRRLSTELANLSNQQHAGALQKKRSRDILLAQSNSLAEENSGECGQQSIGNAVERRTQASNLYLAKAWFHSSQPMTRSRSSELRRRYAALQTTQTAFAMEALHDASGVGTNKLKQEFASPNGFGDLPVCDNANQLNTFMSPSNSSSYNASDQMGNIDKVSSVVSMLKGTLERKKLFTQVEKETVENCSNGFYQGIVANPVFDKGQENHSNQIMENFQEIPSGEVQDPGFLQMVQGSMDLDMQGFVNPMNLVQFSAVSREPSQSESSAAAPVVSSGFDACDGPSNSSQTPSFCESSKKQVAKTRSLENDSRAKGDKGDSTKKRRVERSRKMAEAKERNLTPAVPSDMQVILKRCENLEKEVRSLKLNLSFMNRKDSEQTKQIEELQKQNEELGDEKERLLEEIERIISETGKM
ncbi:protein CYCLOPS-like isoform X2 [Tripterygium wilfordii]|uniref:protein CYCLOPS-like isoform X2 n=1 Tax=Tripterygium wilfordii TaxID=458696 RepID=UPI0018F836FD|nr:protein CYCLOPS-like isoform X2 [Tripterygium wilfordii]